MDTLQDPERARVMTEQLAADIGELATGVSIVGDFDQMDAAWQALYDSISGVGAWSGTNIDMVEGANAVTELAATWRTIYATWTKDRKAGAAMLEKERPKLQAMMTRVRSTLKDSAAINKWVGFGLLVGIALVTGGIGAFVEGVAGVGTLAGFAAATVVEATVFTSLSRSLFSTDPSVGGYLGELGGNVLMFGALKTISMVYVGLVGEVAAGTLKGKAGLLLTQFVSLNGYALYDADKKKRHDTGKGLDGDEVGEISLHNFLFLTATALGSKLVEPGIESLKLKGSYINDLARLRRVKIEMIAVTRDIEAGARSVDRARELVGKQRELIDAEAEAIRKIDKLVAAGKAAAAGLDLAEYARLKSEHATAAAELERSEMALYLEPAGPNTMLCRSEHFDKAQDYYARQPNTKVHPETGTHPLTGARSFEVEPPAEVTAGKAEPATRFRVIERMAGGRAKVTERPEISGQANDLARIRTGTPGRIRPASELSNADVAHSLNDQLQKIRPGEIDDMLGHFPVEQQAHAREVLARSSGFGKMESLNPLRAALQPHLDAGMKLYTPGRGSLADNVTYLASKGTFKANPGPIHTTSRIKPGTVVILDPVVLAEIKADPVFAKSLGDNRAVLVQPRGFNDGINMFNASSPDAIAQRTAHLLGRAETIQAGSKGKLSFDDAISAALDEGTQDALKANPALTGLLEIVDPASHPDLSSGALAQQLNGDAGITEAQIEAVLSSLSEPDRALIRELFAQQAEVFSPRRISNDLVTQHQRNLQTAAQHGINPEKIFYFIPDSQKLGPQGVPIGESYGMVSMAHREATGTPVEHYINGTAGLKGLGPDTMLVILDDVAGTGMSLDAASAQAAKSGYKGEIVVSPLVSTQEANGLFMGNGRPGSGLVNQRPNTSYAPARIMQALESSGFFKSLPTSQQRNLLVLLGDPGFGDNALSMTFPYMAPDNNNALFGDQIAKEFIVNKNRKASKGKSWTTSPTVIK